VAVHHDLAAMNLWAANRRSTVLNKKLKILKVRYATKSTPTKNTSCISWFKLKV
jgi:hypothetical protein